MKKNQLPPSKVKDLSPPGGEQPNPQTSSEKDVIKQITDWLSFNQYCWHFCPNKGVYDTSRDNITEGAPDIIVNVKGLYIGIECKSPKGKQSKAQVAFQERISDAGGIYLLARSVKDLIILETIKNEATVIICQGNVTVW